MMGPPRESDGTDPPRRPDRGKLSPAPDRDPEGLGGFLCRNLGPSTLPRSALEPQTNLNTEPRTTQIRGSKGSPHHTWRGRLFGRPRTSPNGSREAVLWDEGPGTGDDRGDGPDRDSLRRRGDGCRGSGLSVPRHLVVKSFPVGRLQGRGPLRGTTTDRTDLPRRSLLPLPPLLPRPKFKVKRKSRFPTDTDPNSQWNRYFTCPGPARATEGGH